MMYRALPALLAFVGACNAQFKATGFGTDPKPQPASRSAAAPAPRAASAKSEPEPQQANEPATPTVGSPEGGSVTMWLRRAQSMCQRSFSYKPCENSPSTATDSEKQACAATCKKEISAAFAREFGGALEECLDRYVEGDVKGTCRRVELPADADPAGNGSGWPEAKQSELQALCDKQCRDGGAELAVEMKAQRAAEKEGHAIVMAYKRCMLAVASTREAVRYRVHDRDLYDDLMGRTDETCRKKHKCDELENPAACHFGND